jgi:hypothetical protein
MSNILSLFKLDLEELKVRLRFKFSKVLSIVPEFVGVLR